MRPLTALTALAVLLPACARPPPPPARTHLVALELTAAGDIHPLGPLGPGDPVVADGSLWLVTPADPVLAPPAWRAIVALVAARRIPGLSLRGHPEVAPDLGPALERLAHLAYLDLTGVPLSPASAAALATLGRLRVLHAGESPRADSPRWRDSARSSRWTSAASSSVTPTSRRSRRSRRCASCASATRTSPRAPGPSSRRCGSSTSSTSAGRR